ncbi:MAG: NADH-quinone oxidoreductase subunit C [Spirochaetaceae bacterium]
MDRSELFNRLEHGYETFGLEVKNPTQAYIRVKKDKAIALISNLQKVESYAHLSFFTAIDHIERGEFDLIYMLHSYKFNHDIAVLVSIDRENATMDSIHYLWPAAATYQRELREMYGVDFPGSPGVNENFCLEGWEDIPPMRKDFDTKKFSEETFYERPGRKTYDPTEYMREKMYPSEAEKW